MKISHYWEKRGHSFVQQSVRNLCVKFKVDRLIRFLYWSLSSVHQTERFSQRNPLTMETATLNSI